MAYVIYRITHRESGKIGQLVETIAKDYGLKTHSVYSIGMGNSWKHLTDVQNLIKAYKKLGIGRSRAHNTKLTVKTISKIRNSKTEAYKELK